MWRGKNERHREDVEGKDRETDKMWRGKNERHRQDVDGERMRDIYLMSTRNTLVVRLRCEQK